MTKTIKKAPRYFLVHFEERFTSIRGAGTHGKAFVIICDNVPVNVYGFTSEEEARKFNPTELRRLLIGRRNQKLLWDASNEETLGKEIQNDKRIKDGVFFLRNDLKQGPIEKLPECTRMYLDSEEGLLCGKPENEYNDGCAGGCVLQGADQEEEFADGFKCPMYSHWENLFQSAEA